MNKNKIKPFLKWAGNKYHCLDKIHSLFPKAKRLIEPFTGSAAIFMNTNYAHYLLAEQNQDLISLYQNLSQGGLDFIQECERYFSQDNNNEEQYYSLRKTFNQCAYNGQRAALFLYLNRHGYNGLCRYNQSGLYNVPFGRYEKPYFPRAEMLFFHLKSQKATFVQADFRDTFQQAKEGDVIYCDPPYVPLEHQTSNFTAYTHSKFAEAEQIELATLAMEAANRNIIVLISNHDTPFTRHHYRHGKIKSFPVRRWISCQPQKRMLVQELLAVFR